MEIINNLRNILEIGFGILLLIGAIFNSFYTYRNGDEFYGSFVENALLKPAKQFVAKVVIPRNQVFTILMIIFQVSASICIFSRGPLAGPGLIAGGVFAFGAALVSNSGGMIANQVMAILMIYLGSSR
jgi:hypothetical protein